MRWRGFSILLSATLVSGLAATPAFCENDAGAEGGAGAGAPSSQSKQSGSGSAWEKDPSAWKVTIYPIYGWLPVFGAHVNLPDIPTVPGGGGATGPNGATVSGSFNGAGFAGFDIEKSRVVTHGAFLYASVSGDSTNPTAHLGMDIKFGEGFLGYKIIKDLSLEGGVRRMALKLTTSVGTRPEVVRNPGLWDPLIGMTWKHTMGRKWMLTAHFDGGGFGVGSDVTLGGSVRADWRFTKHFGVTMGLAALHFQVADTILDSTRFERTLKIRQTLYGPVVGLGIYF